MAQIGLFPFHRLDVLFMCPVNIYMYMYTTANTIKSAKIVI